jgi:hypothetical protein
MKDKTETYSHKVQDATWLVNHTQVNFYSLLSLNDTKTGNKSKTRLKHQMKQGYGPRNRGSIPGRGDDGIFSLRHWVQTGSGAHPASYPMVTEGPYLGVKAVGTWSWQLTSI